MRLPRFTRSSRGEPPDRAASAPAESAEHRDRRESRRAFANEQGWHFAERAPHAIQGWPRTALPPGPLGRVRNEVTGFHAGRPFRVFDYEVSGAEPIIVYAVGLPRHVPYVYVQDREGGAHDLFVESRDRRYALAVLGDAVRADIREGAITDLVLDRDRLICTGTHASPSAIVSRLDALTTLVGHITDDVWTEWGSSPDRPALPR
ncbi:hypothetical protein ACFQXA_28625 [Nocardiopsis composta]